MGPIEIFQSILDCKEANYFRPLLRERTSEEMVEDTGTLLTKSIFSLFISEVEACY